MCIFAVVLWHKFTLDNGRNMAMHTMLSDKSIVYI